MFHCTHRNGICHTALLIACERDQDGTELLCVQCKTPDDGQRNCPKHVDFYAKNKFEKLVHLIGFITIIGLVNLCGMIAVQICSYATERYILANIFICFRPSLPKLHGCRL